ncbi:MAG: YfhO family protein [Candidatus Curtissbacteria bacterium]|nr:YfhO family protein [Candidatus Curtissbacteria bacterium]
MKKLLVILFLFSLVSIWPFFKIGYFESHDGEWMVIRFTAFHQTFRAGQFPVRFVDRLNSNYGYPVLNFLYPLPFYLAEIPKILGFNFVDSIKAVFAISAVFSSLAMFWALRQKFDKYSAFAGSILYLFIPYRFVDLYVRGSLGESLAFAFVPLCFGAILKIQNGKRIYFPILSASIALLILSHNVIAFLFLPFFLIISLVLIKKSRIFLVMSFLLGILISSFFTVPALYDLKFVRLPQIKIGNPQDHLANLIDLIVPKWGYGPTPNGQNALPVQFGIVPLFIALAAFYSQMIKKNRNVLVQFLLGIFVLIAFLMSKLSALFWTNLPFSDLIQFPWRLLSIIVFISSFLAAYVIGISKNKKTLTAIMVAASIASTILYTKPAGFTDKGDGFYSTNEGTTTVRDEYLPLWVKKQNPIRANTKIQITGDSPVEDLNIRPTSYTATIKSDIDTNVQVNSIYFPGWQVKIDGKITPINYMNDFGLINFQLPRGEHKVIIKYTETPVHTAADLVSIGSLLAAGISFFILWRKQNS